MGLFKFKAPKNLKAPRPPRIKNPMQGVNRARMRLFTVIAGFVAFAAFFVIIYNNIRRELHLDKSSKKTASVQTTKGSDNSSGQASSQSQTSAQPAANTQSDSKSQQKTQSTAQQTDPKQTTAAQAKNVAADEPVDLEKSRIKVVEITPITYRYNRFLKIWNETDRSKPYRDQAELLYKEAMKYESEAIEEEPKYLTNMNSILRNWK